MSYSFIVTLDRQVIYTSTPMRAPGRLRRYFDEIDLKMEEGIMLGSQNIEKPDDYQKQQYAAFLLTSGLQSKDKNLIHVMTAFLHERYPELEEIRVSKQGEDFNLKLINNSR